MTLIKEARQNETIRKIEEIANNTKAQINKLKVKFATEDRLKFWSSLVAFVFLGCLIGFVLLIDFINFLIYLKRRNKSPMQNRKKVRKYEEPVPVRPVYVPRQRI